MVLTNAVAIEISAYSSNKSKKYLSTIATPLDNLIGLNEVTQTDLGRGNLIKVSSTNHFNY